MDCANTKFALAVPTLNAGEEWHGWLKALAAQNCTPTRTLIIDSSSTDDTAKLAVENGYEVITIARSEFNHGRTRQLVAENLDEEIIVFLTQDAVLCDPESLFHLLEAFSDVNVGCAYGRQLPRRSASFVEAHSRYFNYPEDGRIVALSDVPRLGIKAAFNSNSFAAYRKSALRQVGGFPENVILGEDMIVAARMLCAGWKVAYCADAKVFHSHAYTILQEFRRYFDTGVLHEQESWLLKELGNAEGEGVRYVRSELAFLNSRCKSCIPSALIRTLMKYLGYRLGRNVRHIPLPLKSVCSMHKEYWNQ